jgi:hypothetical protein
MDPSIKTTVIRIVCEHLCTESTEGIWRCTCLGKVAQGTDYGLMWYSGDFERDEEDVKIWNASKSSLSNACWTSCLQNECKHSLERGLVYCSVRGVSLESAQLCGITQ